MNSSSTLRTEKQDRRDLVSTISAGVVGIGGVAFTAVIRMLSLFTTDGLTAHAPISGMGSVPVGGSTALVTNIYLNAPDADGISVAALAGEIITTAAGYIAIIVLTGALVLRAARDRAFGRLSSNFITAISIVLLVTTAVSVGLRILGLNGAFASVGEFDMFNRQQIANDAIPVYLVAVGIGALGIIFRRGEKLQRDTEGLV